MTNPRAFLVLLCSLLWLVIIAAESVAELPQARLTIKVMDEDNKPLPDMPVHVWLSEFAIRDGQTDSNGVFVAEGPCSTKDIPISVVKQRYYDSRLRYSYPNYLSVKDHRWQPWNPVVTATVRRVLNPIPMYAKRVETAIPATNKVFGFDLMAADWVQPAGRGVVSDLVFSVTGSWRNYRDNDSTLSLVFSQSDDGLVVVGHEMCERRPTGSVFIMPRYAPTNAYVGTWKWRRARKQLDGSAQDEDVDEVNVEGRDYIFRIRSQTNEAGIVTNAYYGKFHGNVEYVGVAENGVGKGSWLSFTYYLNPTPNDRNLEFDPKRNLFTNLKSTEQVTVP